MQCPSELGTQYWRTKLKWKCLSDLQIVWGRISNVPIGVLAES